MSHAMIQGLDSMVFQKSEGTPWHGIGREIDGYEFTRETLPPEIDYTGTKTPVFCRGEQLPDGSYLCGDEVEGVFSIIHSKTGKPMQTVSVGSVFETFQPQELWDLVWDLCTFEGFTSEGWTDAKVLLISTAGTFGGGRVCYVLVETDSIQVRGPGFTGDPDVTKRYLLFTMAFDGTRALRIVKTNIRVVCANTEAQALSGAKGTGISIRHTATMRERIAEIVEEVRSHYQTRESEESQNQALANLKLSPDETLAFLSNVWQEANRPLLSLEGLKGKERKKEARAHKKATSQIKAWFQASQSELQTNCGLGGTAFAALQGITYWADHERTVRGEKEDPSRRMQSNLLGTSASFKRVARETALALL